LIVFATTLPRETLMKIMFAMSIAVLASLAAAPAALADCQRGDCWGAVAYGPGVWAKALNHRSKDDAMSVAHAECNGRCTNTLWFHNECGAYATGISGMGWGASPNEDTAIGKAINECNSVTRTCTVRTSGCTLR
jgi:hypothetical protein